MARMKVYHPTTGDAYEGEPIDCREMMQLHGYLKDPPAPVDVPEAPKAEPEAEAAPTKKRK